MKKKIISCLLICAIMASFVCMPAFASEIQNDSTTQDTDLSSIETTEPAMPKLNTRAINASETLRMPSRAEWAASTKDILEAAYEQNVANVVESENYITFEFDPNNTVTPVDQVLENNDTSMADNQILKIEYTKPESPLANSSYQTKLVYMWGWSNGKFEVDSLGETLFKVAKTVSLALIGAKLEPISGLLLTVADEIGMSIVDTTPVQAKSWVQYYYLNKVAQILIPQTGVWMPYAKVGSRRGFSLVDVAIKDSAGQWIWKTPYQNVGKPTNNPTNYETIEYKSHFNDTSWIIDKAVYNYTNSLVIYTDVYGNPTHISDQEP